MFYTVNVSVPIVAVENERRTKNGPCMVITYSRVWINRVRLPTLLVVS